MEWLIYLLYLLIGGGIGSALTYRFVKKGTVQKAPQTRPLEHLRIALRIQGDSSLMFTHDLERLIFERGGRIVPLPDGWTPRKASKLQKADQSLSFPDIVLVGSAELEGDETDDPDDEKEECACASVRIFTGDGTQIGTYYDEDEDEEGWDFTPLLDGCIDACEESVFRWQRQESYELLEKELKELPASNQQSTPQSIPSEIHLRQS
jgi:hypothetical protein